MKGGMGGRERGSEGGSEKQRGRACRGGREGGTYGGREGGRKEGKKEGRKDGWTHSVSELWLRFFLSVKISGDIWAKCLSQFFMLTSTNFNKIGQCEVEL